MDTALCPVECVNSACTPPDFIERNGAWLLTMIGIVGGGMGAVLTYFLKSRCTYIDVCCVKCRRDPLPLQETDISKKVVEREEAV